MTSNKRKSAIRKMHKNDYRRSQRKLKFVLQKKYAALKAKHPELDEEQLDVMFVKQQREFLVMKKESIEKQAKGVRPL